MRIRYLLYAHDTVLIADRMKNYNYRQMSLTFLYNEYETKCQRSKIDVLTGKNRVGKLKNKVKWRCISMLGVIRVQMVEQKQAEVYDTKVINLGCLERESSVFRNQK